MENKINLIEDERHYIGNLLDDETLCNEIGFATKRKSFFLIFIIKIKKKVINL